MAAASLLVGLAACTKNTPKAQPSKGTGVTSTVTSSPIPDPCQLLQAQQVASIVSGTVGTFAPGSLVGTPLCNIPVTKSAIGPAFTVQVLVLVNYDRARFQKFEPPTGTGVPVPSVGDQAVYAPSTGGIVFVKGDTVIEVALIWPASPAPDPAGYKAQVIALSTAVASAL